MLPLYGLTLGGNFYLLCLLFALIWEAVLLSTDAPKWWCPLNPSLQLRDMEIQDESLVTVSEATNAQAHAVTALSPAVEVAVLQPVHDVLGTFTGNSLPSVVEISSGTESQKNTEKMTKGWMAGEPGQDPAFAVHLLIVLRESLYPVQFLLL